MSLERKLLEELWEACQSGNLKEVKRLVESGADIHTWDNEAIRWAAHWGHLEVVKYLCEVYIESYGIEWCLTSDIAELREFAKELV